MTAHTRLCSLLALFLLIAASASAGAQVVAGRLRGLVVSQDGDPLAEVRVAVSGRHLQGSRTVSTATNGRFEFVALPPGEYAMRLTRIGLRPLTVDSVTVHLGRTTELSRVPMPSGMAEIGTLRILAQQLTMDQTGTTAGASLASSEFSQLPIERDYKSVMSVLPHANVSVRGDAVNVNGGTGAENGLFVDGVNVTAPFRGETGTSLPYNFVRMVEVKTGGYEAQYGRALGGIVNALTYSGTNDLEGNVFAFTTSSGFSASPRRRALPLQEIDAIESDVGVRIGGPILRDRIWFAAAVNPVFRDAHWRIGSLGEFAERRRSVNFVGKLTLRAGEATDVEISAFGDPTVHEAISPLTHCCPTYEPLSSDPFRVRRESGGFVGTMRVTRAIGDRLIVETAISSATGRDAEDGSTAAGRANSVFLDHDAQETSGGSLSWVDADARRLATTLRATLLLNGHTLVAGAEYEDLWARRLVGKEGGRYIERSQGAYRTVEQRAGGEFRHRLPTAYLQDTWQVSRALSFNAGLRWSSQYLIGTGGRVAQRFANEWQPRVGVVVAPDSDRRERFFASYGRFYQQLPLNLTTLWYVDYIYKLGFYSVDPRTPGATPDDEFDGTTYEADWARNIDGIEAENSDEFTVGYERLIAGRTRLSVRGIHRELRSTFSWGVDPASPKFWALGTPGKGDLSFLPHPVRRYTALELSAEGTWRETTFRGSYVLSRNYGNTKGLFDSDASILNPGLNVTAFAPHQSENTLGLLPNDRTHVAKLALSGPWFGSVRGGVSFLWMSGSPISALVPGPSSVGPEFPSHLVPRGSQGRTPALIVASARLSYELVGRARGTRLVLDAFNLGNQQQVVQVDERIVLTSGMEVSNPNYKKAIAFAPPMRLRLGVEVDF